MKERIYTDKAHLIASVMTALVLTVLLVRFPGNDPKHMVLGMILAVGSGFFICLKPFSGRVSLVLLLFYLVYVPGKLFDRMELPVHDMSHMVSLAKWITVFIILGLYVLIYLFCKKLSAAIIVSNILLLIVSVIEYYVYAFRGSVIGPDDFLVINTAIEVMGNYDYTPSHELIYSVLWFAFFTTGATVMKIPILERDRALQKKNRCIRAAADILVLLILISGIWLLTGTDFLEKRGINGDDWAYYKTNEATGNILYPVVEYRRSIMDKPAGFSEASLKEAAGKQEELFDAVPKDNGIRPNIILIMNESFSDLRVLGNLETNEPFMPFWDTLAGRKNCRVGNLYMPVLGGLTVNSEFEVLTGCSLYYLSPNVIPYTNMVKPGTPSLVSELSSLGYSTMAMHPNVSNAYGREKVYGNLGFQSLVFLNDFGNPQEYRGPYMTDQTDYEELIRRFENRDKEKPLFLFNVTIQNHGGYGDGERNVKITKVGVHEVPPDSLIPEESYLNLIRRSDDALQYLLQYFENVEEPTVICMFGDHQPFLSEFFYELIFDGTGMDEVSREQIKYVVPYMIWANYDADFGDTGDISANYLGEVMMHEAGLPLSSFRKFQHNAQQSIPVLSARQCLGSDGMDINKEDSGIRTNLELYEWYQYDRLFRDEKAVQLYVPD